MKKIRRLLSLGLCLTLLAGCAQMYIPLDPRVSLAPQPSPGESAPVELEPVTPNGLVCRLLELETAAHAGENVILSPLSIEMALGMAANGADGAAREALQTLLGLDAGALNALLFPYLQKGDETLSIANSMWFNESLNDLVDQDFKDTLSAAYAAGEGSFTPGSQKDAAAINGWVKEKTRDKIDSIITPDALTADTLAILINALYFDGRWVEPFEDWQVSDGTFHGLEEQKAQFMSERLTTYFENDWATGFAKDYEEGYEFIGILPKAEGTVDLSGLDLDSLLSSRTGAYDVDIRLPKFEVEYAASLRSTLCQLGLGSLFEGGALNGMLTPQARAEGTEAHVSDVLHKTYMKMYEEGTEAAAVTAVMVVATSAAMPVERQVKQVYLDRPFAFLIRDTQSGQVVFCGVIHEV